MIIEETSIKKHLPSGRKVTVPYCSGKDDDISLFHGLVKKVDKPVFTLVNTCIVISTPYASQAASFHFYIKDVYRLRVFREAAF